MMRNAKHAFEPPIFRQLSESPIFALGGHRLIQAGPRA